MFAGGTNRNRGTNDKILTQFTNMFSNRSSDASVSIEWEMGPVLFEAAHGKQHNARRIPNVSPGEVAESMR